MKRNVITLIIFVAAGAVMLSMAATPAEAGLSVRFAYTSGPADVRVWLEKSHEYEDDYYYDDDEYDVYPSVDDVVLFVRASRSCYTTVYVVDTEGFVHVVHPLSPYDNAYMRGGRVYRIRLSECGFYGDAFGRGVAYAFAVTSPVPFVYTSYGLGLFGAEFGFQIYGDPFIASRQFYVSLVPSHCERRLIGVGFTRFYVREYVRFPSYLCVGWHDYYGVRKYCRGGCSVYRHYRLHAKEPYRALRADYRIKHTKSDYTRIVRTTVSRRHAVKTRPAVMEKRIVTPAPSAPAKRIKKMSKRGVVSSDRRVTGVSKNQLRKPYTHPAKVVRSSNGSLVKGKKNISTLRRELKRQTQKAEAGKHKAGKKNAVVAKASKPGKNKPTTSVKKSKSSKRKASASDKKRKSGHANR